VDGGYALPDEPIGSLHFESDEEALEFLKGRADDIADVAIPVGGPVMILHQGKHLGPFTSIGMIVFMVSGDIHLLHPSRAELILNDGFLHRLRIRIRFLEGQSSS
jgi:hypothetical protein